MDKSQIRPIMLYEFKLGRKAADVAQNLHHAFGNDIINERMVQRWFAKFCTGYESLEDLEGRGCPATIDKDELKQLVEGDPRKTCRELAAELNVSAPTIMTHLHELGKTKKLSNGFHTI